MKGDLCDRVMEVTRDLMRGLALEVVGVEVTRERGRLFLRISIDKEGGITIEDCARASQLIDKVLEREGIMNERYFLEVMSPGVDRPLRTREEFARSVGKRVKVKLVQAYEGKRSYTGFLRGAGEGSITLEVGDELLELMYESLSGARFDPELPW